ASPPMMRGHRQGRKRPRPLPPKRRIERQASRVVNGRGARAARTTTRMEGWDDAATQGTDRGRYAVGSNGGNYTVSSAGTLSFIGALSNASGKFSIKTGGKPQIDLVFNGDTRASMTCPKTG
ncbi:MAG TPA: hypothetical protein VL051_05275, partial [Burkholderiaceae bacterium]|nr:hypothetical protein [Burkholderiaceae bacterium]